MYGILSLNSEVVTEIKPLPQKRFLFFRRVFWKPSVTPPKKSLIDIYIYSVFPVLTDISQKMLMERGTRHLPEKWK